MLSSQQCVPLKIRRTPVREIGFGLCEAQRRNQRFWEIHCPSLRTIPSQLCFTVPRSSLQSFLMSSRVVRPCSAHSAYSSGPHGYELVLFSFHECRAWFALHETLFADSLRYSWRHSGDGNVSPRRGGAADGQNFPADLKRWNLSVQWFFRNYEEFTPKCFRFERVVRSPTTKMPYWRFLRFSMKQFKNLRLLFR